MTQEEEVKLIAEKYASRPHMINDEINKMIERRGKEKKEAELNARIEIFAEIESRFNPMLRNKAERFHNWQSITDVGRWWLVITDVWYKPRLVEFRMCNSDGKPHNPSIEVDAERNMGADTMELWAARLQYFASLLRDVEWKKS